jgi:hypothetical protein
VERHLGGDLVKVRALLDLTVHVTNDLLVPRCALCEVHPNDHHPRRSAIHMTGV